MSTSGSTSYNANVDLIVKGALRMVGAYASNDTPTPQQFQDALDALNMMVKTWQIDGFLWLRQFATLFLSKGQISYNLAYSDVSGFSHCATSYLQTTVATTAAAGASTVEISSAAGMTDGEWLGVANDNGILEWFQPTFAGNVATLNGTLGVQASAGNVVYFHTSASQIKRPTRIFLASRKQDTTTIFSGFEVPLTLLSREEYMQFPNKDVQGTVVQCYYDPQMVTGVLYVWPTSSTATDKLVLTVDRPIQDLLTSENTFDAPQEWMECFKYGLAVRIAPEYGISLAERQLLLTEFQLLKKVVDGYNRTNTATYIGREYV